MSKDRYTLDPYNRLVSGRSGKKSDLHKFRRVIDGRFKVDKNNDLTYHIKTPLAGDEKIPRQIKLKGKWSLTKGHDLCLTLDKKERETLGDKITLEGRIIDVKQHSLLFSVTTKTKKNEKFTYILELGGIWKTDKNNRLTFRVTKEKGLYDILVFKSAWKFNKYHQIIYEYEKAILSQKKKRLHTLTFKGYWRVRRKARLSYEFSTRSDSVFDLNASAGIFKGNAIKYEVGIGVSGRANPVKRVLTLHGRWELIRNVGLVFKVKCPGRKMYSVTFGADVSFSGKDNLSFRLKNDTNKKDIGAELKISRKLVKGAGEAFIKMIKSQKEAAVYVGAAFKW